MKKFLFLMVAIAALAFVGCSDDDKDADTTNPTGMTFTDKGLMSYSRIYTTEVYFVSPEAVVVTQYNTSGHTVNEKWDCSCTWNFPEFTIKNVDGENWNCKFLTGNVEDGFTYGFYPFEKK